MDAVTLTAEEPYAQAAKAIVATRAQAVFAAKPKEVLDLREIEGVHAMRVATRRLRAALEVFGPCLAPKQRRRAHGEVKALAAALGERRDRDVQLELLEELQQECGGAERRALAVLAEELRREQLEANRGLADALRHAKRSGLRRRLARLTR
jgi:CHAD domain-containing protein